MRADKKHLSLKRRRHVLLLASLSGLIAAL